MIIREQFSSNCLIFLLSGKSPHNVSIIWPINSDVSIAFGLESSWLAWVNEAVPVINLTKEIYFLTFKLSSSMFLENLSMCFVTEVAVLQVRNIISS